MSYDANTKAFELAFRDDPVAELPDPTEIWIPFDRHYPAGIEVEVGPGARWEVDAAASRILFFRGPGDSHFVRVRPAD